MKNGYVRLAGLVLAFALVAGLANAGGRLFYCDSMRLLRSNPCSVAHHDDEGSPLGDAACPPRIDCCEVLTLPSMPAGTVAADHDVARPALLSVITPSELFAVQLAGVSGATARAFERWRVPPRPPGEVRARLMVFLT